MKVIFCANDHWKLTVGGPDIWVQRLSQYLIRKGIDLSVCFFYFGDNPDKCGNINKCKELNIPVNTISLEKFETTQERTFEFLKIVKGENPDLIIGNLCIPALYSYRYLKRYGIPVIAVIHANNDFYRGIIEEFIWKRSSYRLNYTVAVSKYLKNLAQLKNKKIIIEDISCGTRLPEYMNSKPADSLNVVYIGRFRQWQKRIFDLTESFCLLVKQVENINCFLYGYGPDNEEAIMQEIINKYNVNDRVFIKGLVPNDKLHQELKDKHVVVLMSEYEGLPMALIEAMAVGLVPVCMEEESGVNEVVKHNHNGLLFKNRKEDFIESIRFLKNNPEKWIEFSIESKKTVEKKYSDDVTDSRWYGFISSIIEDNRRTRTGKTIELPYYIKLPEKNDKINEDIRPPKSLPWYRKLRKHVGLRTRIKRLSREILYDNKNKKH